MSYFDDLDSDFNGGKVSKSLTDEQIRERASMGYWIGDEGSIDARLFASYKQGGVSWDNSLVKRP